MLMSGYIAKLLNWEDVIITGVENISKSQDSCVWSLWRNLLMNKWIDWLLCLKSHLVWLMLTVLRMSFYLSFFQNLLRKAGKDWKTGCCLLRWCRYWSSMTVSGLIEIGSGRSLTLWIQLLAGRFHAQMQRQPFCDPGRVYISGRWSYPSSDVAECPKEGLLIADDTLERDVVKKRSFSFCRGKSAP